MGLEYSWIFKVIHVPGISGKQGAFTIQLKTEKCHFKKLEINQKKLLVLFLFIFFIYWTILQILFLFWLHPPASPPPPLPPPPNDSKIFS